jgi:hypothetical protein
MRIYKSEQRVRANAWFWSEDSESHVQFRAGV